MTRETAPVSFETPRPGVGTRLALTDTGFMYAYGPVPADARTVRLNLADGTTIEAQTAPLPPGVAKGRYSFAGLGKDSVPETVTPLDGDGQPVPPQDF